MVTCFADDDSLQMFLRKLILRATIAISPTLVEKGDLEVIGAKTQALSRDRDQKLGNGAAVVTLRNHNPADRRSKLAAILRQVGQKFP